MADTANASEPDGVINATVSPLTVDRDGGKIVTDKDAAAVHKVLEPIAADRLNHRIALPLDSSTDSVRRTARPSPNRMLTIVTGSHYRAPCVS